MHSQPIKLQVTLIYQRYQILESHLDGQFTLARSRTATSWRVLIDRDWSPGSADVGYPVTFMMSLAAAEDSKNILQ